jgi:hypothetical protein
MSQSYVRIQALVIMMLIIVSSPVSAANVATVTADIMTPDEDSPQDVLV